MRYDKETQILPKWLPLSIYLSASRTSPKEKTRSTTGPAGSPDVTLSEGAWYVEPLLIEKPSGILPEEIVAFCVDSYVRRVAACSLQKYEVPDSLLPPGEMQAQLHTLCKAA